MTQIFSICLCLLIVCGVAWAQEEWMPDPNLRQAVREKLNLPRNTPLTVLHLEHLYDLVILESDIANLQGLEHAVNLNSFVDIKSVGFSSLRCGTIANCTAYQKSRISFRVRGVGEYH